MLSKNLKFINKSSALFLNHARLFSTQDLATQHAKKYQGDLMDPKFYEKDFMITNDETGELEYVRSPFYDLSKAMKLDKEASQQLLDHLGEKFTYMHGYEQMLYKPAPTKESIAYTRYADNINQDEKSKELFLFPRGREFQRINNAELFRIQKPKEHWEQVKRSKSFMSEQFFGPFELRESNLRALFHVQNVPDQTSEAYTPWKERLLEVIPKLNQDMLVTLALHLAYDAKLNDMQVWHAIEDSSMAVLHQLNITQVSQMEWAVQELKPKQTSPRLSTLLNKRVNEALDTCSLDEFMHIQQGFRKNMSKDLYMRSRKTIIANKIKYFPAPEQGQEKIRAEQLANLFFVFASNRPKNFGVYQQYAKDDINELLAIYEEDLKDAPQYLDAEHLTRLAQALYLLNSTEYENILWRIETRINQLAKDLDSYQLTNILRSLTHAQENKQYGKDKTFFNLEPSVIKNLDKLTDRELSHVMYAYSVRNVGNPELYKLFDKKLPELIPRLDYPSLFNVIYFMLFREIDNKALWQKVIKATVDNQDVLPIIFYRPFKASKIYLKNKYPDLDLTDYIDKFWYAERYFNAIKNEDHFMLDKEYANFKGFLNQKCLVYPIPFMTIHNLFNLHFAFNDQKIAINYHLSKFLPSENKEATQMQRLASKVLKLEGWEILDLSEKEFRDWTYDQRVQNVKGWLKEAKERQIKKGIIPAVPKVYV